MDALLDRREEHVGEYALAIGDFYFAVGENVPSRYLAIFQDADGTPFQYEGERRSKPAIIRGVKFTASKSCILQRLDVLGYTSDVCRRRLDAWTQAYKATHQHGSINDALTSDRWMELASKIIQSYSGCWDHERFTYHHGDPMIDSFLSPGQNDKSEGSIMHFDGHGSLPSLRIFVELSECEEISLEVFESLDGDIQPLMGAMCERALSQLGTRNYLPVIIIPEGGTDSDILRRSLQEFFPHMIGYFRPFSFMSGRSRQKVEGSTTNTSFYLRALSEVAPSSMLLGLYDNDQEGVRAHADLLSSGPPDNIIAMTLPDLEWLRHYPVQFKNSTSSVMRDINGCGSTIEMFLGKHNLMRNGSLPPVETAAEEVTAVSFQGQVKRAKSKAFSNFKKEMKRAAAGKKAPESHDDIKLLWERIFAVVSSQRTRNILGRPFPRSFRDEYFVPDMSFPAIP